MLALVVALARAAAPVGFSLIHARAWLLCALAAVCSIVVLRAGAGAAGPGIVEYAETTA